jgi:glycosidase
LIKTNKWWHDAIFYHIYPLGLSGAPAQNDLNAPVVNRLEALMPWLDQMQSLGANALYLGPIFESTSHGYDTIDYYHVDRRLGGNDAFAWFADAVHQRGIRLVLDGVFNHVGREFWAFKDVQANGEKSAYKDWFHNLRFGGQSPLGDPFEYEGWQGHYSLVKLNLSHPHVRDHLFDAVRLWMDRFGIDGLRLDAADCVDFDFMRALHELTKSRRPDFWLMGEVVHGDYKQWVNPATLDSVTNYECYKGLYSSLSDKNYFEIAYGLNRQSGPDGIYRELDLYNFVDNHDVDRVASKLKDPRLLYPLYLLLFTMPGIPSVYYGSEFGIEAVKAKWSDAPLRPALELDELRAGAPQPDLPGTLTRLAALRRESEALRRGDYLQVHVDHQQMGFLRRSENESLLVLLNSDPRPVSLDLALPLGDGQLRDLLNPEEGFEIKKRRLQVTLPPTWGRVLTLE